VRDGLAARIGITHMWETAPAWVFFGRRSITSPTRSPPVTLSFVCDLDSALAALEGDRELLARMIGIFLAETPPLLRETRESIEREDEVRLERAAHTLRGAICNFAAPNAFAAASRVQEIARRKNWSVAALAYSELEKEMQELLEVLVGFTKGDAL
jgi:two-component system sensor histidine kinase/response regulator